MSARSLNPIAHAEALLRRKSAVTIVQLLKLIHDVNPTSRGVANSDRQRRYALKARLQSLLIRRFSEELRVLPGDESRVVSLMHGHAGADACHAVIAELDEDARSWVTYQLDTDAIDKVESATTPGSPSRRFSGERAPATQDNEVTRLVAAGQLALAEFDYEQAALHLQEAQQASQGAIEPTRALLEFWIDQMGADQAALELESRLPRATLANAEIRVLLGIAAVRTRDIPRAERLTRGLCSPRAAEVMGLIAREALKIGDPESALAWITHLRSLDPKHPAIVECEHELRRWRDEERLAAEAELQRLLDKGALDDAEHSAQEIVKRWPESECAARYVRQRSSDRARLAAIQALEDAERDRERGALREATMTLSRALVSELDQELRAVVQEKRAEIERQLSAVADNERVNEVTAALKSILVEFASCSMSEPRVESGLARYLDLPAGLRERVREKVNLPELEWVEPIQARLGARRAKTAGVAVLALVELKVELGEHPAEALIRLQPHVEVLETIAESNRLIAKARHHIRLERQSLALKQLHQAQQALAESTEDQALHILEAISPGDLDRNGRERKGELLSAARASIKRKDLEGRFALLHGQGDFFGARDIASQLAGHTNGDEQLAWIGRRNDLRDEISRRWCWMTGAGEIDESWMNRIKARSECPAPEPWVEPGGVTAILFAIAGRSLLLIRYQLETARVESWVRMVLPDSVENVELSRTSDDVAVLVADGAAVLVVSLRSWEILAYHATFLAKDRQVSTCIVSRDAHWLWCAKTRLRDAQWDFRVQAIEIASGRVVRAFDKADLIPVVGSHDAEVGLVREDCISFHRGSGAILSGLTVSAPLAVVVQAPSGNGLISVIEDDDSGDLALFGPMLPGKIPTELVLPGSSSSSYQLAVALDHSLLAVRYDAGGEQWLEAFVEDNGRLVSLYRVRISQTALLLTDRAGRCIWVLDIENGRLAARRIVRESRSLLFDHHDGT